MAVHAHAREGRDLREEAVQAGKAGAVAAWEAGADTSGGERVVRARLNGVPCLVTLAAGETNVVTGQVAVPPFAGEKAPVPAKGQRATLEVSSDDAEGLTETGPEPPEPIEITVSAADRRTGRFTARFLALSEEQAGLIGRVAVGATPA